MWPFGKKPSEEEKAKLVAEGRKLLFQAGAHLREGDLFHGASKMSLAKYKFKDAGEKKIVKELVAKYNELKRLADISDAEVRREDIEEFGKELQRLAPLIKTAVLYSNKMWPFSKPISPGKKLEELARAGALLLEAEVYFKTDEWFKGSEKLLLAKNALRRSGEKDLYKRIKEKCKEFERISNVRVSAIDKKGFREFGKSLRKWVDAVKLRIKKYGGAA